LRNIKEIKKKLEELKPTLKDQFKVKSIGIFDSYVREEEGKESDLDILVDFEEVAELSLLDFIRLEKSERSIGSESGFDRKRSSEIRNRQAYLGRINRNINMAKEFLDCHIMRRWMMQ